MLRVYVAPDCPGSSRALCLIERLRAHYPDFPVEVIDVSVPQTTVPDEIIGTPIYTWNHRVLFMGNPNEATLLEYTRTLQ